VTPVTPPLTIIHLARKPLEGTVAENALKFGTGSLNIVGCRVGTDGGTKAVNAARKSDGRLQRWDEGSRGARNEIAQLAQGRWPANLILVHAPACTAAECVPGCAARVIGEQSGERTSGKPGTMRKCVNDSATYGAESRLPGTPMTGFGDSGTAARYFKQVQQSPNPQQEELLVSTTPALTIIHLARRPLAGTVAENALKFGTGSLNIDGTRIGSESTLRPQSAQNNGPAMNEGTWQGGICGSTKGRWPANVVLQHRQGCELVGTHHEDVPVNVYGDGSHNHGFYKGEDEEALAYEAREGGQEVEEWACKPGCAVRALGEQSGEREVSFRTTRNHQGGQLGWKAGNKPGFTDTGTAARFFKQAKGLNGNHSHDLIEYLRTMISTPRQGAFVIDTEHWPPEAAQWENQSFCGFVVIGEITQEQVDEMWRLLPPGGHILRIAPDTQPTGHSGAILLEDKGFEIRDAILLVRGPERFHYVPKAARKEREAGCEHLKPKAGYEAVDREEGSAGVENPRAGAGRTAKEVRNFHPTVKCIGVMERLLSDVPKNIGPVCDLFLGSGTTGIACVRTGHDFIGIEREADYFIIADARIRHWDRVSGRWKGAVIESDYKPKKAVAVRLTLDDFFG